MITIICSIFVQTSSFKKKDEEIEFQNFIPILTLFFRTNNELHIKSQKVDILIREDENDLPLWGGIASVD